MDEAQYKIWLFSVLCVTVVLLVSISFAGAALIEYVKH